MNCHCCSGKEFEFCCEPLLLGLKNPATPEELMRSRYSAYVLHHIDYIKVTTHTSTQSNYNFESLKDWATQSDWKSLQVFSSSDSEREGVVNFEAGYISSRKVVFHHELSNFIKENGKWFYVDGKILAPTRTVLSNDPCICGSGKKFKKCCSN